MIWRELVRILSVPLGVLFLGLYIAAKVHFFTRYGQVGLGRYLREHSIYWVAMAATAFSIFLLAKIYPQDRR
jgi:hypothetical protein